jgi:hypothetical protein
MGKKKRKEKDTPFNYTGILPKDAQKLHLKI